MPGKILPLGLLSKMFLTNYIAEFFKKLQKKKKKRKNL